LEASLASLLIVFSKEQNKQRAKLQKNVKDENKHFSCLHLNLSYMTKPV